MLSKHSYFSAWKRTHVRLFWSEWKQYLPPFNSRTSKTVASHATPYFWRETQTKTLQARQVDLSRLRRSLGRFATLKTAASRPNKLILNFMRSTCGKSNSPRAQTNLFSSLICKTSLCFTDQETQEENLLGGTNCFVGQFLHPCLEQSSRSIPHMQTVQGPKQISSLL